ncbi:MAG: SDR family NAD(P)-dependent oxidoreductase, partial [Ginsengibacter sp.]
MDFGLKDKIIIVTGGAKGIGQGISIALAAEGAFPIIIGRNEEDNIKITTSIKETAGKADYITAELTLTDECKQAVDTVISKYKKIDGLVN